MFQPQKAVLKVLTFVFILFFSLAGFTQDDKDTNPPTNIAQKFSERFPKADRIKWEKIEEDKKPFIAQFTLDKVDMRAFFDKNGNLVEVEKAINPKELPERVLLSIRTQYPHEKIIRAYDIEKDQKNHLYEVVLKTDLGKTSLVVSKDGYFTSR